jgi:hypothetical protein
MKLVAVAILLGAGLSLQDDRKAEELFKDALGQAKDSKRKLFLTFGSPG